MVDLRRFFRRDRFAAHAGARLLSVSPGRARARMRLSDRHLNGVDVAQGGAIFTLADLAFAAAANSHGTVAVAVNVAISFVKAAARGTLTADAREVARSARLSTCVVRVTDASGELVALFNGTAYRRKEALDAFRPAGAARPGRSAAAPRRRRAR
jgi:acyl-CoA thioesterase